LGDGVRDLVEVAEDDRVFLALRLISGTAGAIRLSYRCPTDLEVVPDAVAGVAGTSRSSGVRRLVRLGYLA
jgi:hypothetical protein